MLKHLFGLLKSQTKVNANFEEEVDLILSAIGGLENINHVAACATRLRLTLLDNALVDKKTLKKEGAIEVVFMDKHNIQIIYGLKANSYSQVIEQRMSPH